MSPPVDAVSHELKPGELLCDRYRVRRRIADGGMAAIYLAVDETSGTPVAVKALYNYYGENSVVRTRFLDEGRIQAMLRHPNIVHVYRVLHKPLLAFVMEYVDGVSLDEHLKEQGRLDEEEILDITLPVLSALGFAHSKGIIHRDIKPSNILLRRTEEGLEPKVLDFGVAKVKSGRDLTATGTTVGTLHYMSPEQIVGARNIDGRADIYSLGVTLYKLCTGEVPFNASTEFALMMAQVEAPPLPPRKLRDDLSAEMEAIILQALEKEPAKRFQTIKELTSALLSLREAGLKGLESQTAPIPIELLEFAMMANEVATDRTAEYTLEGLQQRGASAEEIAAAETETVEWGDPTEELSAKAFREIDRDSERRRNVETGRATEDDDDAAHLDETRETHLDDLSTAPAAAGGPTDDEMLRVTIPEGAFAADTSPSKAPESTTHQETDEWQKKRRGGGIVAVDHGVDSQEITSLKMKERDYRAALEEVKRQQEARQASQLAPAASDVEESTRPDRPAYLSARVKAMPKEPAPRPEPAADAAARARAIAAMDDDPADQTAAEIPTARPVARRSNSQEVIGTRQAQIEKDDGPMSAGGRLALIGVALVGAALLALALWQMW